MLIVKQEFRQNSINTQINCEISRFLPTNSVTLQKGALLKIQVDILV